MAKSSHISSNIRVTTVSELEWVTLRSLVAARVVAHGELGTRYEWPYAGSEVKVLKSDADKLLQERRYKDRSCCGGRVEPKPVYELVN